MTVTKPAPKEFINLTAHAISLYLPSGVLVLEASGELCRVRTRPKYLGQVNGVPVFEDDFDGIEGLPEPSDAKVHIVSGLVLAAMRHQGVKRTDVLAPGTGPLDGAIRDGSGRVSGVTRLKGV